MTRKPTDPARPSEALKQLSHLVGSLQARTGSGASRPRRDAGTDGKFARTAAVAAHDPADVQVYGVRDAKDSLSKILNDASSGELAFIKAGRGGTVVVMSTNTLAGVISGCEDRRNLTIADALELLPFRTDEMVEPELRGRPPGRGLLRAARTGSRAPSSDRDGS